MTIVEQQKKRDLNQLISLFQTFVADVFFAQAWEDHRLRFPENMTSEYRYFLPASRHSVIWLSFSFQQVNSK